MPIKIIISQALLALSLIMGVLPAPAQETSVEAKQFPTGYFSQYHKITIPEKAKVLAKIDATLKNLTGNGFGLIAKGAVIEKPDPGIMTYPQLTILDESGLVIIARRVPNLFYQYRGKAGVNPNIYIIVKGARVNIPESYIRYSYVVEGEFVAYADKFVSAIMEGLERPADSQDGSRPGRSVSPHPAVDAVQKKMYNN
jgi:hypothetical protein